SPTSGGWLLMIMLPRRSLFRSVVLNRGQQRQTYAPLRSPGIQRLSVHHGVSRFEQVGINRHNLHAIGWPGWMASNYQLMMMGNIQRLGSPVNMGIIKRGCAA